jgi:hypothetical protein
MPDSASLAAAVHESIDSASETLRAELAPEILLPVQCNAGFRNDASLCPEKRLMVAVLERAFADVQRSVAAPGPESLHLFREAERWFESEDTVWRYSFANICQALGLDVTYVRGGLRRWRDAQRARALRGEPVTRAQLRRWTGIRSKAAPVRFAVASAPGGRHARADAPSPRAVRDTPSPAARVGKAGKRGRRWV